MMRRCKPCGAPRPGMTCWKCGADTFEPCEGWEDPELPPVAPIRAAAREVGYAIGEHGSRERDLDLIAAPWTDEAVDFDVLLDHIAKAIGARIVSLESKPGRACAATLQMDGWFKPIDISVCAKRRLGQ